ncbi:MAG: hypothetical protein AAF657_40970 [Acidobacteriota bacterium]
MRSTPFFVGLIMLCGAASAAAQTEPWLPTHVEQQVVGQLAERLGEVGQVQSRDEDAARTVAALRRKIESWNVPGLLQRAPQFPELQVPKAGQPHLDAMASYNICNLILYRLYADPALRGDVNQGVRTVKALTGLAMTMVYLRQPFQASGGTDEQLESLLAGEAMNRVFTGLQENAEQLAHAASGCGPVLQALTE